MITIKTTGPKHERKIYCHCDPRCGLLAQTRKLRYQKLSLREHQLLQDSESASSLSDSTGYDKMSQDEQNGVSSDSTRAHVTPFTSSYDDAVDSQEMYWDKEHNTLEKQRK